MRFFSYIYLLFILCLSLFGAPANSGEITLKGENLKIYDKEKRFVVSGNVSAEGDDFILLTDSLEIYDSENISILKGDLTILGESILAGCERAEVFKKYNVKRFYNLKGKVLRISVSPKDYLGSDRKELGHLLEYRFRLRTSYLRQIEDSRFFARDVNYTLCNCAGNNTWELSASSLYYEKNGFLLSLSNLVYFYGIPVFYVPAIIAPVGERRSGFLLPETGFASNTGYSLRNAYYQTLGESADTTLYLTLMSRKGEMYSFEFRYKPLENLYGKIMFSFVDDSSDSPYKNRFSLKNEHRYEYPDRLVIGLNTNIVSDSSYMYDFLFDFWDRNTEYTISRFYIHYRRDYLQLSLSNDFYQNFKQGMKAEDLNFFSETGLAESQRLPSLLFSLLPQKLFLNTDVMLELNYVNYYSFSYDLRKVDYSGNPLLIENDKRTLLSFQRFGASIPLHNYFQIENVLNVNQSLNSSFRVYQLPYSSYNLATSLYSAGIDIELYRDTSLFTHILKPQLEYKNLFYLEYTKDNRIYHGRTVIRDEKDNYIKSQYALLHLKNYFYKKESSREIIGVDIAQGYQEIVRNDLTPLIIRSDISVNYLSFYGDLFYYWREADPYLDTTLSLTVSDKRNDSVTIRYQKIENYLQNPLVIFNEEFEYLLPAYYERGLNDIFGNLNMSLSRELSAGYFITYSFGQQKLLFHGSGVYYHSKCNCLNAGLTIIMYDWYKFPSFMTSFNLGGNI